MLINKQITKRLMVKGYWLIIKGVFIYMITYYIGRTVLTWRPRRFGGGKGQSRYTK